MDAQQAGPNRRAQTRGAGSVGIVYVGKGMRAYFSYARIGSATRPLTIQGR